MGNMKNLKSRLKSLISNWQQKYCDSELRAIKRIIELGALSSVRADKILSEHDEIFVRRLEVFPQALKISYWENHFEWESLNEYPEIDGRILDFGCGSGHLDVMLARTGRIVHGIDLSNIGITIANYLKSKEDKAIQERLSFSVSDVTESMPDCEKFDSAWSAHVFEHISDPGPVLKSLRHWLKPDAYILISVPLGHAYDDPGHVNHFSNKTQFETFLKNHICVEKIDICEQNQVIRALGRFS